MSSFVQHTHLETVVSSGDSGTRYNPLNWMFRSGASNGGYRRKTGVSDANTSVSNYLSLTATSNYMDPQDSEIILKVKTTSPPQSNVQ